MRVTVEIDNKLPQFTQQQVEIAARAVTSGVSAAAMGLKTNWRGQVAAALGNRLSRTVRAEVYPKGQTSTNAAAMVWTKAPKIISAHENGALIRSANGFWLAVPLPAAGKSARGGRITPGQWEAKTGRRLRFVYRSDRTALLVADDSRINKRGLGVEKKGRRRKDGILTGGATVPIFFLTPQVRLKKRLNLQKAGVDAGMGMAAQIRAAWRPTR